MPDNRPYLGASVAMNGGSIVIVYSNGSGAAALFRHQVASFVEEYIENLEKHEIAHRLVNHILDEVQIDDSKLLLEQVRLLARKQVQSMPAFWKAQIRKQDCKWTGSNFKSQNQYKTISSSSNGKIEDDEDLIMS